MSHSESHRSTAALTKRFWLTFLGFALVALFFLWEEHEAHILGLLPYLLVLACPLMHIFMHHGHRHGHHDGSHQSDKQASGDDQNEP